MKNSFKILVATDYSKASESASRYALELAKSTGSELVFFHVFQEPIGFPTEFIELERMDYSPVEFELRRLEQHVEDTLQSIKLDRKDIKFTCRAGKGNVTQGILKVADDEQADIILVGTHGASVIRQAFFGSHTWDAIKRTSIPVLAIPEECIYSNVQNIVFATEYRASEIPLLKFLIQLAMKFNAELTVLHVANNVFSAEFEHQMFDTFRKEVQSKVDYSKLSIRLINNKDLIEGLNGFCTRSKGSWLIMSHERATLLAAAFNPLSVTKKMSFHTHIPLFAVPDGYKERIEKKYGNVEADDFFVEEK